MRYNWSVRIGANWSTTERASDKSMSYPVVDYTKYASSIEEFIGRFPYVTIETDGEAISESTFGDMGRGQFGSLTFETILFNNRPYMNKYMVYAHLSSDGFNVGAEIGIGFRNEGNKLYLRPFTNGWMHSVGYEWRYLTFGLSVSSITFHPNEGSDIFPIFHSNNVETNEIN